MPVCHLQLQLCMKHKTTKDMQQQLRDSHIPIAVYVALQDKTIPTRNQLKMAKHLGAHSHEAKTAHMCVIEDFNALISAQNALIASAVHHQ